MKFLHLNFLPRSTDAGLLVLRLWLGGAMAALHGYQKLMKFSTIAPKFADPFGVGPTTSLALTVFAELLCAVLLALGIFTRACALVLAITMAVAFFVAHGGKLSGPGNGELAFLFLGGYLTLLIAGGGRYSLDAKMGAKV